ncbi:MAG: response regulator transcription factor [Clostridia bacterium]|nr:response regulator transcription factor [Clostridia bacterium]MBO5409986.1 response regulator transcription factor [Clostridia bacterium]
MINVLIVEDDPMARKLLEIYINDSEKYKLSQSIESAAMAELYFRRNPIDLILMDVCTAMDANGLEAAAKIKKSCPHIKIIIVTSQPEFSFIERARKAGVESFWYKSASAEEIIEVMNRTMAGDSVYPDTTPSLRLGEALNVDFTEKEFLVLREVVDGEADADIAEKLGMSVRTVKAHIQNMRDKTGFRNRTELAVRVRESGLVINDHKTE